MAKQQQQPFESTLQDLVYSVDAGAGLKVIRTLLFCLFFLVLTVIFTAREFQGFTNKDAMDYAQLGRNLARSGRYVTQCVRPVSIAQVSANTFDGDALIDLHPELIKPPLYPALLAANFKFFDLVGINLFPNSEEFVGMRKYPAEQWVIIPIHHIFTALCGLFIYLLGGRLFSKKIGLLGVTTFFFTDMVWRDSILGTGIPILEFFVLGAVYFAVVGMNQRRERRPLWSWMMFLFLAMLFSAAAFLTNYAALAVIPGIALFIWMMGTRTQRAGHLAFFYLATIFLIVSPWLLRNYQVSGSPLGLAPHTALVDSAKYPGDSLMRTLNPTFNLFADFAVAKAKWVANFDETYVSNLTTMGGGLLIAFFMVTFFYRFVRVHVHNLRWGIGLSMVLFIIGAGFFGEDALRLYHIFWPFVILYGLAFFSILLDRLDLSIDLYKFGLTVLVIALTGLPLAVTILLSKPPEVVPPYYAPFIVRISGLLKPNEVMCTDIPWATAWYGQRNSILLPQTLDDYYEINDYRKYISGLYLTNLTKDRPFVSSLIDGPEKTWFPITMGRFPQDFPLRQAIPLGLRSKQEQVFLTDSVRWSAGPAAEEAAEGGDPAAAPAEPAE